MKQRSIETKGAGNKSRAAGSSIAVGLVLIIGLFACHHVYARTALVIGNSTYASAPLDNPVNDATDMASKLGGLGFDVTVLTNASRRSMRRAIREYSETLRATGDVGLFYFAGHGMQIDGVNYLIPVDAVMQSEFEIPDEAVAANSVLRALEEAGNDLNIVILDACRDNPFAKSYRSAATRGLARMDAPGGSIVAYSTAPGAVALDGNGRNGVYTKHLLDNMEKPGMPIEQMFKKVRIGVIDESGGQQTPWEESSLRSDFYFSPAKVYEVNIPDQKANVETLTSTEVQPEPKTPAPQVAVVAPATDAAVANLLRKAGWAMRENRLTTPASDNALFYYRETLRLDPVNLDAHEGMQKITRRYINLAERELDANNLPKAERFITRGLSIHPTNSKLQDLRLRTEEIKIQQARLSNSQNSSASAAKSNSAESVNVPDSPPESVISQPAPQPQAKPETVASAPTNQSPENQSRVEEQTEAFKKDVKVLKDSIKGLGKSLKGGFSGLFKKKSNSQ